MFENDEEEGEIGRREGLKRVRGLSSSEGWRDARSLGRVVSMNARVCSANQDERLRMR